LPLPAGQPGPREGVVPFCTTPVGTETAVLEPSEFEAVTAKRIVFPTSAEVRTYRVPAAPPIAAQLFPLWSQRCHA
jgi:hypothetical protein